MSDYLFYLLLGAGAGAIIAALGLGLVVTYQGSGVVNFAHGAMTMWVAYVYADLRSGAYPLPIPGLTPRVRFDGDVGFAWAMVMSLVTAAALGLFIYWVVFRPLRRAPLLANIVASIGVLIVLVSLVARRFSDKTTIRVGSILPREPVSFSDSLTVPRDGLWLTLCVLLFAGVLSASSRYTRVGLQTRAAAENEKGAILRGLSPERLAAAGFVVASVISGLVGILAAPMIQLDSSVYTFAFFIPALGAALVGKFRSVWATVGAGLAIGMIQSTFTKLQGDVGWFPKYGAREGLPFVLIIVAMMVFGEGLPSRGEIDRTRLPSVPPARISAMRIIAPMVLASAGLIFLGPLWRAAIMTTVIASVIALSFVVLTGFGGQTSLAQLAFAGIAGFGLSRLATEWGVPFPLAPLLAAVVAAIFGVLVGIPALRIRGTNLAIVTLAGGLAIAEFIFKNPTYVGGGANGAAVVPNPRLGGWDLGLVLGSKSSRPVFGIVLVIVLAALCVGVANLRRSTTGRRMLAIRSNERAASAIGINVARGKVLMYAISGFIAGIGGCLIAYRFGSVSDASFGVIASITALAVAYLGGITSVSGALTSGVVAASGVLFFVANGAFGSLGEWEATISGVALIVIAVRNPEGLVGTLRRHSGTVRRYFGQRVARSSVAESQTVVAPSTGPNR